MSLIIIPIDTEKRKEPYSTAPLLEVATLVSLEQRSRAQDTIGKEIDPFFIIPLADTGFDTERWDKLETQMILNARGMRAKSHARDGNKTFYHRLKDCIRHTVRHDTLYSQRQSLTIICPVLVIANQENAAESLEDLCDKLKKVYETFDEIDRKSNFNHNLFRIVPWMFFPSKLTPMPETLFRGPTGLGNPRLGPIIHGGMSHDGNPRLWQIYGATRLIVDLILLHALSTNEGVFTEVFMPAGEGQNDFYYRMHSSLFEYPEDQIIRENLLNQITTFLEGILPKQHGSNDDILQDERETINNGINDSKNNLRNLIIEDIIKDADYLNFQEKESSELNFKFKLSSRMFHRLLVSRKTDRLHTAVLQQLEKKSKEPFEKLLKKALEDVHKKLKKESCRLEIKLQNAFGGRQDHDNVTGRNFADVNEINIENINNGENSHGLIRKAYARVITYAGSIATEINNLAIDKEIDPSKGELPSDIIEDARNIRSDWVQREEDLIRESERLPSETGIYLEAGIVFSSLFLGIWCLLIISKLFQNLPEWYCPVFGGGAGFIGCLALFFCRRSKLLSYETSWKELGDKMLREANNYCRRLVRIANRRMRLLKYKSTRELVTNLRNSQQRFQTEMQGFEAMVREELADLESIKKSRQTADSKITGRFTVNNVQVTKKKLDEEILYSQLKGVLLGTLTLNHMPDKILIRDYHQLIRNIVEVIYQKSLNDNELRTVDQVFNDFWEDGTQQGRMTAIENGQTVDGNAQSFFMIHDTILNKLGTIQANIRELGQDVRNINSIPGGNFVSNCIPANSAVIFTREKVRIDKERVIIEN